MSKVVKRIREDGQLSKKQYESEVATSYSTPSTFTKASQNDLSTRRIVAVRKVDKKQEFSRTLNKSFFIWFKDQVQRDDSVDLSEAAQDYIDYATQLEDRYLRTFGEVLTFGNGDCGQLAHGIENDEDLNVPFPRIVYSLRDKKVCAVACGGLHNAVVTSQGQVYSWGCNDDGSLGRPGDESMPLLVAGLEDEVIIDVSCGDGQTIAVSTSGRAWGWGCFKDKEGKKWFNPRPDAPNPVKDMKRQQDVPMELGGLANVIKVACGAAFSVAMCSDGSVYSWGLGECGELAREVPPLKKEQGGELEYDLPAIHKHHITPQPMLVARGGGGGARGNQVPVVGAKAMGCGAYHSLVVVVGGKVLACGLNQYSQLGFGDTVNRQFLQPVEPLNGLGVIAVAAGVHHSMVLTSAGKMFAFGRSDSGQMGVRGLNEGDPGSFSEVPVEPSIKLPTGVRVTRISCGGNHNLALTSGNEVYTWGYGDMLALGHGVERDEPVPKKLNFKGLQRIVVSEIAGGGQHSAIIGRVTEVTR